MREAGRIRMQALVSMLVGWIFVLCLWQGAEARETFAQKEQATTEADPTQSPSFDEQKKGIPIPVHLDQNGQGL